MNCGIKSFVLIGLSTTGFESIKTYLNLSDKARLLGIWCYGLAGQNVQVKLAYYPGGIFYFPVFSVDIPVTAKDIARGKWFGVSGMGAEANEMSAGNITAAGAGTAGYDKVAGSFPVGMPLTIESTSGSPLVLTVEITQSAFGAVVFYYTEDPPTQYGENGG